VVPKVRNLGFFLNRNLIIIRHIHTYIYLMCQVRVTYIHFYVHSSFFYAEETFFFKNFYFNLILSI
jgi:hypothetical protein